MKRFNLLSHLAYAALLTLGCSLFAVSCKDDDNENDNGAGTEQVTDAKDSEQAMSLLGILKAVADVDTLPDHWTSATFEPTVGYVLDAAKPYVRSIAVENASEAAAVYANLTDKDYNASLTSDSWSLEGVGSLTYKLENKSDVIATIDCQLKQVPHLTQLRLVKSDALGDNASSSFKGEAYYNFGDVVYDTKEKSYWICVRPALQNVKGDSHWFSFNLQESNYKVYEANAKKDLKRTVVPTKLGKNVEMMGYLMNLLSVISNPDACADYFQKGRVLENGLGNLGAGACSVSDIKRIATNWQGKGIWNYLPIKQAYFQQNKDVTVFYYGYSSDLLGGGTSIYGRRYSGDALSQSSKADLEWDRYKNMAFDAHCYAQKGYKNSENQVGPNAALIVRYRSSKDFDKNANPLDPFNKSRYEEKYRFRGDPNNSNPLGRKTRMGDVFRDKTTGAYWMTLLPSSYSTGDAILISFDSSAFKVTDDGNQIANVPTRHEACRILEVFWTLSYTSDFVDLKKQLKDGLNLDLTKMIAERDSTYMIHGSIPSESTNPCTSIIYNDAATGKSQLLRLVIDNTRNGDQAGEDEEHGYTTYHRFYTHYLAGDKAAINWADVMDADKVRKYALDFWTRIRLTNNPTAIPYRRAAETGKVKLTDYAYSCEKGDFVNPALKNMFNEPVILCAYMTLNEKKTWPADLEVTESIISPSAVILPLFINRFESQCEDDLCYRLDDGPYKI